MMIITQTPVRLSLFGGGTDYPQYFNKRSGATISTSIDKFTYITVNKLPGFFEHRIRIGYSITELCRSIDEIKHPSARECLRMLGINDGIEINVISDLPARSGLGSSSSFTVGLLNALYIFLDQAVTKDRLAEEAIQIEREMLAEHGGWQDQYICAHGGFKRFDYSSRGVSAKLILIDQQREKELNENLMLFYTGMQRSSHKILKEQVTQIELGEADKQLHALYESVDEAEKILCSSRPLREIGELLHETWLVKRSLSKRITNSVIDQAYDAASSVGAVGGKILGAGGGGFMLLYVEPDRQVRVMETLKRLQRVDYCFEHEGTKAIFYQK